MGSYRVGVRVLLTESASSTAQETLAVLSRDAVSVDLLDAGRLT
jgi:hypothetical protein